MEEQLTLPLEFPPVTGYVVQLRSGSLHNTDLVRENSAETLDQAAVLVEGFQSHAAISNQVQWNDDQDPVKTGFLGGLGPHGVVWEIRIQEKTA